jgi:Tol biopolymer transport system component
MEASRQRRTPRLMLSIVVTFGLAVGMVVVPLLVSQVPAHAAFPAENGLIAFSAETDDGIQLFTVRRNGNHLQQITQGPGEASTPDWSPDGRWLAYSRNECTIALIRANGTHRHIIPSQTPDGCETDPAFTPDGQHLVFSRYDAIADEETVWIMNRDGTGRRLLGAGPGGAATAEVSPDGQTVTFLSFTPDDLTALFAVNIDGGDAWQVTPTLWGITFKHDWAPDGSRLVMSDNAGNPDRPANILTIRPDGTGLRYLTHLRRPDRLALAGGYSPNGKWITYRLEHGDQSALMIVRPNGHGEQTVLPFSSLRPRFIDWGPAATS